MISASEALKAELNHLRHQHDPHFLFNALGGIASEVTLRPKAAVRMVHELADYLRYSLDHRDMSISRRVDIAGANLQRQGQLALWVPSHGQEAAQVGSARAARPQDHIFPSYREHIVGMIRGLDPVKILSLLRGITQGGSFASIYQSAVLSYGAELVPNPVDSDYFVSADALKKAEASGAYKDQVAAIVPLQSSTAGRIEADPLLSRDIRFYFEPMSAKLDTGDKNNLDNLTAIKRMLDVSPGSRVLLVGHVDDSNKANLRKQGGEDLVRRMALEAMDLSKQRATEIRRQLIDRQKVEAKRIETVGRGWEQPVGTNPDLNRRVEVQWFTLE